MESADIGFPLWVSPAVLRELIPLQRGELFNVERIRTGLKNLTQVYAREGYVDMTAGPEFEMDEDREAIDMVLKIDLKLCEWSEDRFTSPAPRTPGLPAATHVSPRHSDRKNLTDGEPFLG